MEWFKAGDCFSFGVAVLVVLADKPVCSITPNDLWWAPHYEDGKTRNYVSSSTLLNVKDRVAGFGLHNEPHYVADYISLFEAGI